jgi:hypothetical protein
MKHRAILRDRLTDDQAIATYGRLMIYGKDEQETQACGRHFYMHRPDIRRQLDFIYRGTVR